MKKKMMMNMGVMKLCWKRESINKILFMLIAAGDVAFLGLFMLEVDKNL